MRRSALLLVAVAASVAAMPVVAPTAVAQKKSSQKKASQKKAASAPNPCTDKNKGTLALDGRADELVADVAFKRQTGDRHMTLVYNVTGCTLPSAAPRPTEPLPIYPSKAGGELADGSIKLTRAPSVENGGKRYLVPLTVSSSSISPGNYTGLVQIGSPVVNPVRTSVSVSRSENRMWVPVAWGLFGALGGFGLFTALRLFKGNNLRVTPMLLTLAGVISLIVGAIAALTTSYLNQDVWTSDSNAWAAVVIGFTASTSGVMTALLAAVWDVPEELKGEDDKNKAAEQRPAPAN